MSWHARAERCADFCDGGEGALGSRGPVSVTKRSSWALLCVQTWIARVRGTGLNNAF